MAGALHRFLHEDHQRLDALVRRAVASPDALDREAYGAFRAGLLRHIAMEEKVLLPEARRVLGEPLPIAKQLRADHAVFAALLVPTPTPELLATLRQVLEEHNPLEEDPGGLYETCERLLEGELDGLLERLRATPAVRLAEHRDGPRVRAHIASLLRERKPMP